jgi:hypothetical protein
MCSASAWLPRSTPWQRRSSFSYPRTDRQADTPISRWQFQTTYPSFTPELAPRRESRIMLQFGGGPPEVIKQLAVALRDYQLHGGYTPGPLLAVAGLTGLAAAAGAGRRWDRRTSRWWHRASARSPQRPVPGQPAERPDRRPEAAAGHPPRLRAACFLVTATAVVLLMGADMVEFSWRYQLPGLVTLPLAGALGVTALTGKKRRPRLGQSLARWEPPGRRRAGMMDRVSTGSRR